MLGVALGRPLARLNLGRQKLDDLAAVGPRYGPTIRHLLPAEIGMAQRLEHGEWSR